MYAPHAKIVIAMTNGTTVHIVSSLSEPAFGCGISRSSRRRYLTAKKKISTTTSVVKKTVIATMYA
jgi:hypothetical protein